MSQYTDEKEFVKWMEAVADDAHLAHKAMENGNDRHPLATWLQGVEFAARYAAYEGRAIQND